jgi:hypothetical protein
MAQNIPPRPVPGQLNRNGGIVNEYDVRDYDRIYGSPGAVSNPDPSSAGARTMTLSGSPESQAGEAAGRSNASIYYGSSSDLGNDAADYRNQIKSKVGKSSGLANRLTQTANADISRANAKAGLRGLDTSAASIRERRNSIAKSNEMQQSQDAINLANYGKSISAGISGTEALAAAGAGRGEAGTQTPTPSYGGGLLGSIICTELYRQNKLTLKELVGTREFRELLSEETYFGYLVIAKPIVALMKRSDKFSNLFVGWAKSISRGEMNRFTRLMIPICRFIGSKKLELSHA